MLVVGDDLPELLGDVRITTRILEGEIEVVLVQIGFALAMDVLRASDAARAVDVDGNEAFQLLDVLLSPGERHAVRDDPNDGLAFAFQTVRIQLPLFGCHCRAIADLVGEDRKGRIEFVRDRSIEGVVEQPRIERRVLIVEIHRTLTGDEHPRLVVLRR